MKRVAVAVAAITYVACRGGDGVTTLEVASWAAAREAAIEQEILPRFAVARPGVRVALQAVSNQAEYRERILTSMAAGAPPDVFLLDGIDIPAFVHRGVLLDLRPFAARLGIDLARFEPTVLNPFVVDGGLYAFPKGYTPMVIAYNKDVFDRAGVAYPSGDWTWDEYVDVARRLTRDTDGDGAVDQWGAYFDRRVFLWIPWIWAGGGDVLCAGGTRASGCLDAPATIEAIRFYTSWVTGERIAPRVVMLRQDISDNFRLFASGQIATMTAGHFWVPTLLPHVEAGRLRLGFAPIPHRAGVPPATVVYASGFAVPHNTPHRRLAVELAAFLADSMAQTIRAGMGLELPAHRHAARALLARDTTGWEAVFAQATRAARPPWGATVERWREVELALGDLMDLVTLEGRSPDEAARIVAGRVDAVLRAR